MIIKTNSCIIQGGSDISGLPIEIDNETDMGAVSTNPANVGKLYLFTGATTTSYTNGAIYMCIDDSEVV